MPIDMASYMRERRASRRAELIELAGGLCIKCGAPGEQFDHRDPKTVSFRLSGCALDKPMTKIMEEFAKCDLLCESCHRDKSKANGETGGGHNRIEEHGSEVMWRTGRCKCSLCKQGAHDARVARGELKGTRGPYG
jgi:5-methylcytosine-specific restriction endonuclease McrA